MLTGAFVAVVVNESGVVALVVVTAVVVAALVVVLLVAVVVVVAAVVLLVVAVLGNGQKRGDLQHAGCAHDEKQLLSFESTVKRQSDAAAGKEGAAPTS